MVSAYMPNDCLSLPEKTEVLAPLQELLSPPPGTEKPAQKSADSICVKRLVSQGTVIYSVQHSGYVYRFWQEPGPGNARGENWLLRLPHHPPHGPKAVAQLNHQQYAFLGCQTFQAHRYCNWDLRIRQQGTMLEISGSNAYPPCKQPLSWQAIFQAIAAQFQSCQQPVLAD